MLFDIGRFMFRLMVGPKILMAKKVHSNTHRPCDKLPVIWSTALRWTCVITKENFIS